MCALCGVVGVDGHWTAGAAPKGQAADPQARRAARAAACRAAERLLAPARLKLRDWGGDAYVLSSPTGASVVVQTLGEIWPAVERLSGRRADPLAGVLDPDA